MLNQNWALFLIEEFSEFERHFGRDAAPTENDFVDASWADAKGSREGVLGNAHGHEIVFEQNFTGCDGGFHRGNFYPQISQIFTDFKFLKFFARRWERQHPRWPRSGWLPRRTSAFRRWTRANLWRVGIGRL